SADILALQSRKSRPVWSTKRSDLRGQTPDNHLVGVNVIPLHCEWISVEDPFHGLDRSIHERAVRGAGAEELEHRGGDEWGSPPRVGGQRAFFTRRHALLEVMFIVALAEDHPPGGGEYEDRRTSLLQVADRLAGGLGAVDADGVEDLS